MTEYELAQQQKRRTLSERLPKQGVVEESSPRSDERTFSLRDENGRWWYIVTMRADECDDNEIEMLWRLVRYKQKRRLNIVS